MTLTEQLESKPATLEVSCTKLSETLMAIREHGGWCPRMDVGHAKYTLTIVWEEKKEKQGELI